MEINQITGRIAESRQAASRTVETKNENHSFSQTLSNYMNQLNDQLLESEKLNVQLAAGKVEHLHDVTIAAEKALIALQLTTQVRDKAIEAYQEVMRMQI